MTAEPEPVPSSSREALLAVAPAVVLATVFLARGLVDGPTLDGAVFALVGDAVAHGAMPYRDVWDHKPPGAYLANAAMGMALPGVGAWPRAWLVSWLSIAGALVGLSVLLRRSGRRWPAILAVTLLALPLFAAYHFALGGGQTESVGLVFAVLGIGVAASARSARSTLVAGVLTGAAVLVSVQFLPALAAVAAIAALNGPSRIRSLGAVVLGSLVVPGAVLLWLVINGALPDAIDQLLVYNRAYVAFNQGYRLFGLLSAATDALFLLPLLVAALARILVFRRAPATRLEVGAVVWLATGIVFLAAQGLYFAHYATALAPPLVILAAPSLAAAIEGARRSRWPRLATTALIVALAVAPIGGLALTESPASPIPRPVVDRVRELTNASDPIFVWGNDAALYLAAERPFGSRFVYMFPLTLEGYATPGLVTQILQAWETRPPRMVIDATHNPGRVGGYPLTPEPGGTGPDAVLDPLRTYILSHYRVLTTVSGWDLYVEEPTSP